MKKQTVLFLCTHNSARSQMAQALLQKIYGDRYESYSAGVKPTQVHPYAIEVMKELDIDISKHRSKSIEEFRGKQLDYVVTVCDNAKANCPFFPGKTLIHRGFTDPATIQGTPDEILSMFRKVRDEIKTWIIEAFGTNQQNNPPPISFSFKTEK